jgi:hypothetical protein
MLDCKKRLWNAGPVENAKGGGGEPFLVRPPPSIGNCHQAMARLWF